MKLSNEAKVGCLILATAALAVTFAWVIGIQNPFNQSTSFYVTYNFAGGIEVGSPVRVSGIKVGKVERIDFFSPVDAKLIAHLEPGSDQLEGGKAITPLKVKVSVHKN